MVTHADLKEDEEYEDVFADIKEEVAKFGALVNMSMPRPKEGVEDASAGVLFVFLQYADIGSSTNAAQALHGRRFGGRHVVAAFYPKEAYLSGDLSQATSLTGNAAPLAATE
jgi:splicing factor U2AF subunit